jgi:hypothetical protein
MVECQSNLQLGIITDLVPLVLPVSIFKFKNAVAQLNPFLHYSEETLLLSQLIRVQHFSAPAAYLLSNHQMAVSQLCKSINIELAGGILYFKNSYFPAAPVQNAVDVGGNSTNGGAESWVELSKALNNLGDSRLSVPANVLKWAVPPYSRPGIGDTGLPPAYISLPEFDYSDTFVRYDHGSMVAARIENVSNALAGTVGSSCFAMAIDLETSNGGEISGLNAEEQSDISLLARWNVPQASGFVFDIYTYIDSMIVLRENNVTFLLTLGKSKINNRF